jgi:hypothetical protein
MIRILTILFALLGVASCNHNDENNSCQNSIEVTGTPSAGYIIIVKESNDSSLIATEYIETYIDKINVYTTSITFFAAEMDAVVLSNLQCDSRIESIEYDSVVVIN